MDGSYLEAKIYKNIDGSPINKLHFEEELFKLAMKYVVDNKLGWDILPPRSWFSTSAHVTLNNNSLNMSLIGQEVIVEIGTLKHWEETTRWVALNSKVHTKDKKKLSCPYNDCHISIGYQKIKPSTGKLKRKKTKRLKKKIKRRLKTKKK